MKRKEAITLIALVITIVVLIILAAVAINLSLGNNGIFNRAKTAKEKYNNSQIKEETDISMATNEMESKINSNRGTVTISEEEYNILKNANSYSSDEKVVGTYLDGKPLYQKTYSVNTPSSRASNVSVATLPANCKKVVEISGFAYCLIDGSEYDYPINCYITEGGSSHADMIACWIRKTEGSIAMRIDASNDTKTNKPAIITLKYTKTTD